MQVYEDYRSFQPTPNQPLYVALGNFDGLHRGHKQLLSRVKEMAREGGGAAAVFTFQDHPQRIIHPESKTAILTSKEHKLYLLNDFGVELCFLVPFTNEFAHTEPADFVEQILVQSLYVKGVVLGYNARFGRGRQGDSELMSRLAAEYGFSFEQMAPVRDGSDAISSTAIRQFVTEGDLEKAAHFLGRPFSVFGSVVPGDGRGRELGFPTANLEIHSEVMPPEGVYPVKLRALEFDLRPEKGYWELERPEPKPWLEGVLNFGSRPTFKKDGKAVPEVYIFDFSEDLYGKSLEVVFYKRLREEMTFDGPEALKQQIEADVQAAHRFFDAQPK